MENLVKTNPTPAAKAATIKAVRGPITVDKVVEQRFESKKNMLSAWLRQEVTKSYPSGRVSNSHQDSLYDEKDFNFENKDYKSTRMAFIPVPLGTTEASVKEMLKKYPESCIYQIISNRPILTEEQEEMILLKRIDIEDIAYGTVVDGERSGGQLIRYGNREDLPEGVSPTDPVYDKNGRMQFSVSYFSKTFKPDMDLRSSVSETAVKRLELEADSDGVIISDL